MNSTAFEELALLLEDGMVWHTMFYISIALFLLYVIIFPFYVFVNKVNRKRDEKMAIFPITNHLYLITKVMFPAMAYCWFSYLLLYFDCITEDESKSYTLYLSNQMIHILLIALAVERLIIYFCPTKETSIILLQNYVSRKIKLVYLALFIKDVVYGVALFKDMMDNDRTKLTLWRIFFLTIYYTIQILLFLSAFLYIPIMISVRKLSHLTSSQVNHPQRYIFWQTAVVVLFKIVTLPIIVLQATNLRNVFRIGWVQLIIEMVTIPLLITTSYLGCNKRNVTVLFSSFKLKHFLRVIFGGENAAVEPQQYIVSINSTL